MKTKKEKSTESKDHDSGTSRKITIIIDQKPFHFESTKLCPDDFRKAVGADDDYEVWKIVRQPDPEGQLPKDDEQVTDCIEVKSGDRFKVVPPGTFGGPQGSPDFLKVEIEELRALGYEVEVQADGTGYAVVLNGYQLPKGYSVEETDLLLRVPQGYPHANPDMFWVEAGVVLENGRQPKNANKVENHVGRRWRRFSWHINKRWHPGRDNLTTYLGFVDARLARKV